MISAVLGVAFALGQHDMKRLLAYHSIENIGIIFMGTGIALLGQTTGQHLVAMLGMAGALLHTLNHALFKSLLFLGAGSAIHGAGTRDMERMGGLGKYLPWTSALFLVGAVAICGLPPLNGFVSEYLIYMGIFRGITSNEAAIPVMALAAPALALVGALAVACFVKVCGICFLGTPREMEAEKPHEAGWPMRAPLIFLALLCVGIGLLPQLPAKLLTPTVYAWWPKLTVTGYTVPSGAPLGWISILGVVLVGMGIGLGVWLVRRNRQGMMETADTWGCGYLKPTPRMQYTASSFAEMIVKLFRGLLRPHMEKPSLSGPNPAGTKFKTHVPEAFLELVIVPFFTSVDERFNRVRRLQHGRLPLYILYIFITLCLLLTWAV
jgi:hydrogenase-4 component B